MVCMYFPKVEIPSMYNTASLYRYYNKQYSPKSIFYSMGFLCPCIAS
jgi:hypothetical protein